MSKKEIVEKILDEYSQYGLGRIEVEISYLMAIIGRVPKESIYPGMRLIFNQVYGIADEQPAIDAGKALFSSVICEVKNDNSMATDKEIANSMDYVGIDALEESLEDIDFSLLNKVKQTIIEKIKEYIKINK